MVEITANLRTEHLKKQKNLKIALVGNPNSGKSTLFNVLTGLNQNTGNFPGVTVDKKTGSCNLYDSKTVKLIVAEIIDLPGIYSLAPKSLDEHVAYDVLCKQNNSDYPDITVVVVDASNLKRNLLLASQVIDLNRPTIVVVNMIDLLEENGSQLNIKLLAEELGVPVVAISARKNKGVNLLTSLLAKTINKPEKPFLVNAGNFLTEKENEQQTIERYRKITIILNNCTSNILQVPSKLFTHKLDKILTHKIAGYILFMLVLFAIFQCIFYLAAFPMQWIETSFIFLSHFASKNLPDGELTNLFVDGILSGLSGIVVFVPQIAFLFFFIAILEDTGYMARVSFIMDKVVRRFGLNGKSVIPLISGVACAVPSIMSTRTIGNWKERFITIMVTPLVSCSARLPVFTLLIAMVVPAESKLWIFSVQGIFLMAMYLIGFASALGVAYIMKLLVRSKEKSYFIMELPLYRLPRWKNIALTIIEKVKIFLWDAGKIIIAISIVLWYLSTHAPQGAFERIDKKYAANILPAQNNADIKKELDAQIASEKLEVSYAGLLGKSIEPAIKPLGFNWKIGIALVTSFAAREVFVGTMATIYSAGDQDNTQSIRQKMQTEQNPETGERFFSVAVCFSLMLFYLFAMQCMSTMAVVYRETRSLKWPLVQFIYMGAMAYIASFIAYNLLN